MHMTRQEVYDHIWTKTVQGFAEEFELNYPILLRKLKEADIPRPSRKEIVFIKQGDDGLKAVHRPPLPGDPEQEMKLPQKREAKGVSLPERGSPQKPSPKEAGEECEPEGVLLPEAPELIDFENHPRWTSLYFLKTPERRRVIRETESIRLHPQERFHPYVLALQREIAAWRAQVEILGNEEFAGAVLEQPPLVGRVSVASIERVLNILDSLYQSVENLGGHIREDGSVVLHDQVVSLKFTESRARAAKELSVHEEVKQKGKRAMVYTGRLSLSVGYLYSIRDRKNDSLEDRLGDILELLFLTAFQLSQNPGRARDAKQREQDSFNRELERTEDLIQQARDYEDAERIRTLLKAVQKKLATGELEYQDYWPTWAAWASEKAEWLDPTVGYRDEVLGRRHDPILQPPKQDL